MEKVKPITRKQTVIAIIVMGLVFVGLILAASADYEARALQAVREQFYKEKAGEGRTPTVELVLVREGNPMNYLMSGINGQANEAFRGIEAEIIGGITYANYLDGWFSPERAAGQILEDAAGHKEAVFWGISMGMTVAPYLDETIDRIVAINPCPNEGILKNAIIRFGFSLGIYGDPVGGAGYGKTTQQAQAMAITEGEAEFSGDVTRVMVVISGNDELLGARQIRSFYEGATFAVAQGAKHASINAYSGAYLEALRELGMVD